MAITFGTSSNAVPVLSEETAIERLNQSVQTMRNDDLPFSVEFRAQSSPSPEPHAEIEVEGSSVEEVTALVLAKIRETGGSTLVLAGAEDAALALLG